MRLLLLVHHFPPDVNSTGRLMHTLARGLRERGHEVTVVTSVPHYEGFRTWERYRRTLWRREVQDGLEVHRVFVYAPGHKSMANRLANYLTFNAGAAIVGRCLSRGVDAILCPNGSFFTGLAALAAGAPRIPYVYNIQDLYPEVPILAGELGSPRQIRVLRALEAFMYNRATKITVITASFADYLLARGVPAGKVEVIPNFVDTETIRPLPRHNAVSARLGLDEHFVVAHMGNLGYAYDLETLLEAAHALRDDPGLLFLIVGDGVAKARLQERARALRLDNVRFLAFQAQADLPELRAAVDVSVSLYRRGSARYSMPSKVYEIMASARPILLSAEEGSDVRHLVCAAGAGLCVDPEALDQLTSAILALRSDPAGRERMGRLGRECAIREHSAAAVISRYDALLRQLPPPPRASRRAGQARHG